MSVLSPCLGPVLGPYLQPITARPLGGASFAELNLLASALDPRISFTRASTKTYIGADGLLHMSAANEWPLEYDPVTLLPTGRSAWEARTNLLLHSDDVGGTGWAKSTTAPSVAPNAATYGVVSLALLGRVESANPELVTSNGAVIPVGAGAVMSCFVSQGSAPISELNWYQPNNEVALNISWANGSPVLSISSVQAPQPNARAGYVNCGSGVFRVWVYGESNSGSAACQLRLWPGARSTYAGSDVGTLLAGGAQIEAAATPGPYIPTTTAQVTRAADVATVNALSTVRFNPTSGAFYVEHNAASGVLLLGSGSNTILTSQGPGKIAVSYNASGSSVSYNGAAPVAGPALVFGPDLKLGFAGTAYANNGIKRVRCYPNGANVQAITT